MSTKRRPIDDYCLPLFADCTPYVELEFDPCVREFCQQRATIQQSNYNNSRTPSLASNNQHEQTQTYDDATNNKIPLKEEHHHQLSKTDKLETPLTRFEPPLPLPMPLCAVPVSPTEGAQRYNHYTSMKNVPHNCKIIVAGDVAVGKTSLINRFGYDLYSGHYKTTIGVDFDVQKFQILGMPYALHVWDTAGLERFKSITSSYYRGCQVAIIVFDMSNLETLKNAIKWRDEVIESCQTFDQLAIPSPLRTESPAGKLLTQANPKEDYNNYLRHQQQALIQHQSLPILFLVGSKSDLINDEVDLKLIRQQAKIIANRMQAELWMVSAQTGENVNELFTRVATLSFNKAVMKQILLDKYEASTLGYNLKQKVMQQQKELWNQGRFIKITRKKKGDDKRSKCVNIQCVIK